MGPAHCDDIFFKDKLFDVICTNLHSFPDVWKTAVLLERVKYDADNNYKEKSQILSELLAIYRNCVTDKTWNSKQSTDAKLVALTAKVEEVNKSLKTTQVALTTVTTPPAKGRKPSSSWQNLKKGETTKHPETGATYKWCNLHGKSGGCYMPEDHDHDVWLAKRKKREADQAAAGVTPSSNKVAKKGTLRLDSNIKAALATRLDECGFSGPEKGELLKDFTSEELSKE